MNKAFRDGLNHREDRVLSFFFGRRNWVSPIPSTAGEWAPSFVWFGGKEGGGVPIQTRGHKLWYYIHIFKCT
jgi:hypothetical protein